MKRFLGKIGKYRKLSQRGRSKVYLSRSKTQHKMDTEHWQWLQYQKIMHPQRSIAID